MKTYKMINKFILLYILFLISLYSVIAKRCEEYEVNKCGEYIYSESDDKSKQCIYNYEEGKCEFKSCSELSGNCHSYKSGNKEYNCIHKLGTNNCELQKCTELDPTQCYDFETNDEEYQCILNENYNGYELKKKKMFRLWYNKMQRFWYV